MQEKFTISDKAIKLNYILNVMEYSQDNQEEIKNRIETTSRFLFNEYTKRRDEKNIITILTVLQVSKAIDDDQMMIKAYEYLIQHSNDKELQYLNQLMHSDVNLFKYADDEEVLNHISDILMSIGVTNIKNVYDELDMLQAEIFNKPIQIFQ